MRLPSLYTMSEGRNCFLLIRMQSPRNDSIKLKIPTGGTQGGIDDTMQITPNVN